MDHEPPPAAAPEPPRRAYRYARLILTIVLGNLHNAVLAGGRLVMPIVALDQGASKPLVGLIAALFMVAPMFVSVHFGRWIDNIGSRRPMIVSALFLLTACILMTARPAVVSMFVVAPLIGLGAVVSHIAATRAVASFGEIRNRTRNLGYLAVGYSLFQFMGPFIAGVSYDQAGTRAAFLALAMLPLITLAILTTTSFHLYASTQASITTAAERGQLLELAKLPRLRRWMIVYSFFSSSHTLFPFVLSLYAVEAGLNASQASLLLGMMAVGAMISRMYGSSLDRRLPSGWLLAGALLLAAGGYVVLPLTHAWTWQLALSLGLGLSLGIGVPIATSLVYDAAPEGRQNEAMGLTMTLTNFLQLTLPLALGLVAAELGVATMFWAIAVGLLLASGISGSRRD